MHELCGLVYYSLSQDPSSSFEHVESVTYHVFSRVLNSIISLYDPRPVVKLTEKQERINAKNRVR